MILIKSFVLLAIAVSVHAQAQNVPGGMGTGMRMHKRHDPSMKKRIADAVARSERRSPLDIPIPGQNSSSQVNGNDVGGSSSSDQQSTTTTSSQTPDPPPPTSTTTPTPTPTPTQNPPTTTSTTTTSSTPTTTSTTSTSSSTTTSTTSSSSSTSNAQVITAITRTSQDTYAGISFATTNSLPLRASTTSSDDAPTDTPDASGGSSKVAIAATATVAALVVFGALIFLGFWWKKKSQRGRMGEDTWDEASMKEFSHGAEFGAPVVAPPPVARHLDLDDELGGAGGAAASGLGRSNTKILPSQSAYVGGGTETALARSRSQHTQEVYEEEPDELLAMPPVAHHERPRDSAYDIVPAAPPTSAYAPAGGYGYPSGSGSGGGGYGAYSTSGGLAPPHRKGDHTSYGSGIGHDPFAGSGFVDASRESTYGPGQAGRGAGGAGGAGAPGVQGPGSQWPQGYNPYTGYSQGSQAPYGQAGYGYAN